jgi:hypothetical protein
MSRYNQGEATPSQDTGWGLIFRLNDLLRDVETLAVLGRYGDWNFKLDRIWANLCYREEVEIEYDDAGNITKIKLKDIDIKEKNFLDASISEAKLKMKEIKSKHPEGYAGDKEYIYWKNALYKRLLIKDIWIRKQMRKYNLYMKEIKHNPAGAMFGR